MFFVQKYDYLQMLSNFFSNKKGSPLYELPFRYVCDFDSISEVRLMPGQGLVHAGF